jgi:ribonucleotide reductase alpha subunit
MVGAGVGFSVQKKYISQLPVIGSRTFNRIIYTIPDTRKGWADSIQVLLENEANGVSVDFDYSLIRKKGSRLKSFGGRASGSEPLAICHSYLRSKIDSARGRKITSLEAYDLCCAIAEAVIVGGIRRSACICAFDPDDQELLTAKSGDNFPVRRFLANNSMVFDKKPTAAEFLKIWSLIAQNGTGEPGILNLKAMRNKCPDRRDAERIVLTNPCLTGDSLIYVADGRGLVSFKELAESGNDVDVFCLNAKGDLVIRKMRNPRKTGTQQNLIRVTFDDGSTIRCTPNHKFRLKTGEFVPASELKFGDGVSILTRYETSIKKMIGGDSGQLYWWLNAGKMGRNVGEHRLVAAKAIGLDELSSVNIVHHRDFNAQNNSPNNLEILTKLEHDRIHGGRMRGDRNPMKRATQEWSEQDWADYKGKMSEAVSGENNGRFCGSTNEELRRYGIALATSLGRSFTPTEWVDYAEQNGLPSRFSKFREAALGVLADFAVQSAKDAGLNDLIFHDLRVVETYKKMIDQGYETKVVDGRVFVVKHCEKCGKELVLDHRQREVSFCSSSCYNLSRDKNELEKLRAAMVVSHQKRKEEVSRQQVEAFKVAQMELGRIPMKKEWIEKCKTMQISFEISRKSSPFRSFADLTDAASKYNHKVVNVEPCGQEDVYNGTVDEFHNYFVSGLESKNVDGTRKMVFFNTKNCGETALRDQGLCNLSSVVLRSDDDLDDVLQKVETATWLGIIQSTFTDFHIDSPEWTANANEERLLGVSVSGQMDAPHLITKDNLTAMKQKALKTAKKASKLMGINMPAAITCIKPDGTVSQLVDSSSGMHERYAKYYIRRYRISTTDPLFRLLNDQGVPMSPEVGQSAETANTYVVEFPIKSPEGAVVRSQKSALEQLEHYRLVQQSYCEMAASMTIYIKDSEWLLVGNWLYENWDIVCGLSFLPYDTGSYKLAPYEEITEDQYLKLVKEFPKIDYTVLSAYETEDQTEGAKTYACIGNLCELK